MFRIRIFFGVAFAEMNACPVVKDSWKGQSKLSTFTAQKALKALSHCALVVFGKSHQGFLSEIKLSLVLWEDLLDALRKYISQ